MQSQWSRPYYRWCGICASTTRLFFFFQAEDGIRDYKVTGVQTCALPISLAARLQVSRELMRVVTAVHDAAADREAGLRRVPREDLDDAADRIGAVQRRSRPAHDLDAVDLLERDELERRNAQRRRADARAIDQQQRVIGGCAAQEHRARLAQAAGVV